MRCLYALPVLLLSHTNPSPLQKSERIVRINPVGSGFEEDDIRAVLASPVLPDGICLPKSDEADHLRWLDDRIATLAGDRGKHLITIGMVETARAVLNLREITTASPRMQAIIFGGDDYAADVGATRTESNEELFFARNATLLHCAANGLQAIDVVNIQFNDEERLRRECVQGFNMGFTGKQIIHPKQIAPVQETFSPSKEKIQWSAALLRVLSASANVVFVVAHPTCRH